jgi:hypothetical protein
MTEKALNSVVVTVFLPASAIPRFRPAIIEPIINPHLTCEYIFRYLLSPLASSSHFSS